jgi:hypothetical protein
MQFLAPYPLVGVGSFALHFHPDHLADLRKSGLADDTIRAAGVYSLRPADLAPFFDLRRGVPAEIESALCFPYQGGDFSRIKLFPALGKMKYSQPPRTGARLYLPFPVTADRLYVVEGEKKTLAAWQMGLNAIGIGGVWNWLSHGQTIDDIGRVNWGGRDVCIVGDSDIWQRTDLLRALYALGAELVGLGARVDYLELPRGEEKVGLDDFLVAGGDLDSCPIHSLRSKVMARQRLWHQGWMARRTIAQIGGQGETTQE